MYEGVLASMTIILIICHLLVSCYLGLPTETAVTAYQRCRLAQPFLTESVTINLVRHMRQK